MNTFRSIAKYQNLVRCLAFLLVFSGIDSAIGAPNRVALRWDPNQEPDIAGYYLYYGDVSRVSTKKLDVGNITTTVIDLADSAAYFFFVTAYNTSGLESDPSNEVQYRVNSPPTANPQSVSTLAEVSKDINLKGSDVDGDSLGYTVVSAPGNGTLFGIAPILTYRPNPGYTGVDTFVFLVSDGKANSAPATVTVIVNAQNDVPNVSLINPAFGARFSSSADITLSAISSDDGSIAKVEFFSGGTLLGAMTESPYSLIWKDAPLGTHVLMARATDDRGAASLSSPVLITVIETVSDPRLLGYWAFDDSYGEVAADSSPYGRPGILLNGPQWSEGRLGGALRFDGVDDYVLFDRAISDAPEYTIAAWFKTSSTKSQAIYCEGSSLSEIPFVRLLVNEPSVGMIRFEHQDDAGVSNSQSVQVNAQDGRWHHAAVVRLSPNKWRLYFDGRVVGELTGQVSGTTTTDKGAIGALCGLAMSSHFAGAVDDVRAYGRALDQTEIQSQLLGSPVDDPQVPTPNTVPVISDIPNVIFFENSFVVGIEFAASHGEILSDFLRITVDSSNRVLLLPENIFVNRVGKNWRMALLSEPYRAGTTTITVNVSDGFTVTSKSFIATVLPR